MRVLIAIYDADNYTVEFLYTLLSFQGNNQLMNFIIWLFSKTSAHSLALFPAG